MNQALETAKVIPVGSGRIVPAKSIGAMLMDLGKITPEEGERILRYARDQGVRFGDAAIALNIVSEDEVDDILSRQFDFQYLRKGESAISDEVVAAWAPFSQPAENLRAMRSQLLLRWFSEAGRQSLAVVGPGPGDGRSHLVANLAVVLAQMGERTLVVDADLRSPRQHVLFGLSNSSGLTSILAGRADFGVVQKPYPFNELSVLTAGPVPPNPSELLGRSAFAMLMDDAVSQFDVVLVDTAAGNVGADAQLVASRCSGALLVARRHRSSFKDCKALADALALSGTVLAGSVLNAG